MRMWMGVPPTQLCKKHLLGEHNEYHKHRHIFVKKHSIKGRLHPEAQIEPLKMKERHDMIAEEMINRGMKHNTPYEMPDLSYLPKNQLNTKVDQIKTIMLLHDKCKYCRERVPMLMPKVMRL